MSWEYHASRHVRKHAFKHDIFWTSLKHKKLCIIWEIIYGNISNQKMAKVWQKFGKNWPKGWQIVGQKTLAQHRPKVWATLPLCWLNVEPTSPQCWIDISDVGLMVKSTLGWRHRADVALTIVQWLARCWPNLLMLAGSVFNTFSFSNQIGWCILNWTKVFLSLHYVFLSVQSPHSCQRSSVGATTAC